MSVARAYLLSALGGALGFLGYVGFDQFYLGWIFLVPVLHALRDASPRQAFFRGWVLGTVGHAGGFYWMGYLLEQFGQQHAVVAWLGVLGIGLYHGLSVGLWGLAVVLLRRRGHSPLWTVPAAWVAMEHLYPFLFPMYLGAGQYRLAPLMQVIELTGPLGMSFLVAFGNAVLHGSWCAWTSERRVAWRSLAGFGGLVATLAVFGMLRIGAMEERVAAAPKLKVGLVQVNLGAGDKTRDARGFLSAHRDMTRQLEAQHDLDLIVWPESVVNLRLSPDARSLGGPVAADGGTPVLLGVVTRREEGGALVPYSEAILVEPGDRILGRYEKRILIPFGEYVPLGDKLTFLKGWSPHQGNYRAGTGLEPIPFREWKLSASICYEDIHPAEIRRLMTGDGEREELPHLLVNLTNDSWYGDSTEPLQHLVLASLRCIEHRRAMVRVTNTGISALITPWGRFQDHRTGQWKREVLVGEVPLLTGRTVYSRLGDWPPWPCMLALAAGLFRRRATSPAS